MKVSELREKTLAELKEKLLSYKEEQFNLRMQKAMGQLENSNRIADVKREVARIKTIMTEKERAAEVEK
ncbi:MAG: 50S ribosomal protein L29 [bacterium]